MFLHKKSLKIANKKRAKNYLKNVLEPIIFDKIDEMINNRDLPLEMQDSEDITLFAEALAEVLKTESKIYQGNN